MNRIVPMEDLYSEKDADDTVGALDGYLRECAESDILHVLSLIKNMVCCLDKDLEDISLKDIDGSLADLSLARVKLSKVSHLIKDGE